MNINQKKTFSVNTKNLCVLLCYNFYLVTLVTSIIFPNEVLAFDKATDSLNGIVHVHN